jgi:3-hydroxybutyryl-CoA dehydrogenase
VTTATSVAEAVATADLIIESVPESMELKLGVLAEAERSAPDGVVIATNTSSLSLDRLAASLRAPERFLGWHWFNPAHLIPLVEVVPTELTDPGVVAWSVQRLEQVGKRPLVLSRPVDGFLANRLQYALIREALALIDAGVATPEQIDAVLTDCLGLRWAVLGPMRSTDLAGITTAMAVATELFPKLSNADRPPACLNDLAEQGRLGLSAGAGFYAYPDPDEVLDTRDRLLASVWDATQRGRSERP